MVIRIDRQAAGVTAQRHALAHVAGSLDRVALMAEALQVLAAVVVAEVLPAVDDVIHVSGRHYQTAGLAHTAQGFFSQDLSADLSPLGTTQRDKPLLGCVCHASTLLTSELTSGLTS